MNDCMSICMISTHSIRPGIASCIIEGQSASVVLVAEDTVAV